MNKIGLVGGIGPESTISYYRQLVHGVKDELGEKCLPRLSIETLSAFEVFSYCNEGRYDDLASYVLEAIDNLAAAGAKYAALTGNTPNVVLDRLQARSPIPLVSAIEETLKVAKAMKSKRVGLLGTIFTMNARFFQDSFEQAGIHVITPNASQKSYVQERIETELEHGIVTDQTRDGFIAIIRSMQESAGIEQVILGCTELPLLLNESNSPVPCLDTASIHVAALVKLMTTG